VNGGDHLEDVGMVWRIVLIYLELFWDTGPCSPASSSSRLNSEDGGSIFLGNGGTHLTDNTLE
jgi:hypothetical protein